MKTVEISFSDITDITAADDFAIARLLVERGFEADGGPIQPKLTGIIESGFDYSTDCFFYKQKQNKSVESELEGD